MKKYLIFLLIFTLVASTMLVGCSNDNNSGEVQTNNEVDKPSDSEETTERGVTDEGYGVLNEASIDSVGSFNPHTYSTNFQDTVIKRVVLRLYAYVPSEDRNSYLLTGQLANDNPKMVDEDGKVWRISLREGATWPNGEVIDAYDAEYSFKQLLDPKLLYKLGGTFASNYITIVNANQYYLQNGQDGIKTEWEEVGIKVIDNLTLEITTVNKHSVAEVMSHFASPTTSMVEEETYELSKNSDGTECQYGTNLESFVSAGPFLLDQWNKDSLVVFKKNPNFIFKDEINLAGIVTKIVESEATQMQLFESGDIDYVKLSADNYKKYEQDPRILISPAISVNSLSVNTINPEQPILNNLNFRMALFHAIDRAGVADVSKDTPANYWVSTRQVIDPVTGLKYRDTDLAKANVIPNLGYDPELAVKYFETALKEEGLDRVDLTLLYSDQERYKIMSEFVQNSIPKVLGEDRMTIKVQAMPNKQIIAHRKTWRDNPACYEITWTGWSGNELAPWNAMKFYTSSRIKKNEPFFNEEFDKLFDEANMGEARFEEGKRLEYTARMEQIFLEEMPMIPVVQGQTKFVKSERVELTLNNWVNVIGFGWEYSKVVE